MEIRINQQVWGLWSAYPLAPNPRLQEIQQVIQSLPPDLQGQPCRLADHGLEKFVRQWLGAGTRLKVAFVRQGETIEA